MLQPIFNPIVDYMLKGIYDDSSSLLEFVAKLHTKINEMVTEINLKLPDDFEARFYAKLREYTSEELNEMLDTGELSTLVLNLITSVTNQITAFENSVNSQIDAFETSVNSSIATQNAAITDLTTDLNTLDGAVTVMDGVVDTLVTDVADLKNRPHFVNFYNSDGAVTKALNNALSYKGNNVFVYGNGHTLFDDAAPVNGKYELDCSSFIQAVLEGIPYQNSKYFNSKNFKDTTGYYFSPSEFTYSRMLANDLCEHAYKNGYLYYPLPDYSNVHPGDLIFMSNSDAPEFFMQVGHVMLVERVDQNGNITIIDANTRADVVAEIRYSLNMLQTRDCTVCARFPLPDVAIPANTINYGASNTNTSYKASTGSVIRTVTTMKDIIPNKMYTMILKAAFVGDPLAYPLINLNGTAYTWAGDVERRPDGLYHVSFHLPTVPEGNKRTFTVLGAGEWSECTVSLCALYEGAVSHWNGYVDNIPTP